MRKGIFDFDGDGKLDVFERAAEMQFIDEVILAEEQKAAWTPDECPVKQVPREDFEIDLSVDDVFQSHEPDSLLGDEDGLQNNAQCLINPPSRKSTGRRRGEIIGISFLGRPLYDARKDSDGVKILKSLGVIISIIAGFAIPMLADMGDLGMILFMGLGIGMAMLILKNT